MDDRSPWGARGPTGPSSGCCPVGPTDHVASEVSVFESIDSRIENIAMRLYATLETLSKNGERLFGPQISPAEDSKKDGQYSPPTSIARTMERLARVAAIAEQVESQAHRFDRL